MQAVAGMLYVDDPPQAEAVGAASTESPNVSGAGYMGGSLPQGSSQSPVEWLPNLHGTCMEVLPLPRREASGHLTAARGQ
jgi:hypothetical protein